MHSTPPYVESQRRVKGFRQRHPEPAPLPTNHRWYPDATLAHKIRFSIPYMVRNDYAH